MTLATTETYTAQQTCAYLRKWYPVSAAVLLLTMISKYHPLHAYVALCDYRMAELANSLLKVVPWIGPFLAWLCTWTGDICIALLVCLGLGIHCLSGRTTTEIAHRVSFWSWTTVLCLCTYLFCNWINIPRDIPLLDMPNLIDVERLYGIHLRTDPTHSYPSGHALAFIFFALMAWRIRSPIAPIWWMLVVIMPAMRLVVGIHWLSDILLGSLPLSLLLLYLAMDTPLATIHRFIYTLVMHLVTKLWAQTHPPHTVDDKLAKTAPLP